MQSFRKPDAFFEETLHEAIDLTAEDENEDDDEYEAA
jgi:hypothetical protein